MRAIYDAKGPTRPVDLSLDEDQVALAREVTDNLSVVESSLADDLARERARRAAAISEAVETWNRIDERHGCFAGEHSTL